MRKQRTINNSKGLAVRGIVLCCLSMFFGGFYSTLADCRDSLAYALRVDEYSLRHYWKRFHGGARLWRPWSSFQAQHLRAEQLQIGLVGLTKAEQIKRFGPPDTDMPHQPSDDEPLQPGTEGPQDFFHDFDEYLWWDLDATTVLNADFKHGVCVRTQTGELFY
jgi:hypothetical protein